MPESIGLARIESSPANDGTDIHKQVSNSSVQISTAATAYDRGMIVEAPTGNDQTIWLKISATGPAVSGEGIEMKAGKSLTFRPDELQDASKLWAIAAAASSLSYLNVVGLKRV